MTSTPKTPRERAIAFRKELLEDELRKQAKGFRSNELWPSRDQLDYSERSAARLRREIAALTDMSVDVSIDEVRRAMGVSA